VVFNDLKKNIPRIKFKEIHNNYNVFSPEKLEEIIDFVNNNSKTFKSQKDGSFSYPQLSKSPSKISSDGINLGSTKVVS
jgi:hypothetical protein